MTSIAWKRCRALGLVLVPLGLLESAGFDLAAQEGVHWPSFRGYRAQGVSEGHSTPVEWDVETGDAVRWRTPIPGLAHSSPVIWGDRLCVTTAVREAGDQSLKVGLYGDIKAVDDEGEHEWKVYCLDKNSGEILWEHVAHQGAPKVKRHTKSTHANSTPATDGQHLVAFFGSEGLFGYDLEGNLLWNRDLGVLDAGFYSAPTAQWGFGSSPIIQAGKVLVQCDVLGDDFVAAFDVRDGRELWRTAREEVPTWSTPTIYEQDGQTRLAVNGWQHVGGYDLETGAEVWWMNGGGDIPVPTPVVAHELIYITNSHGSSSPILAVRTDARGDVSLTGEETTNAYVAWGKWRDGAYMPTPIVYGDYLYVLRDSGAFFCYDARTGVEKYKVRLGKGSTGFSASPVAADGKLYVTSEVGDVYVIKAGSEFELLGENSLGEVAMATPAISEGTIYFRTRNHIIAVASAE